MSDACFHFCTQAETTDDAACMMHVSKQLLEKELAAYNKVAESSAGAAPVFKPSTAADVTEQCSHNTDDYPEPASSNVCSSAMTDPFGKTLFPTPVDARNTLYIAKVVPVVHYTMGGLEINTHAQVLKRHKSANNMFSDTTFSLYDSAQPSQSDAKCDTTGSKIGFPEAERSIIAQDTAAEADVRDEGSGISAKQAGLADDASRSQVSDTVTPGAVIPGLYAAGEAAGG